MSHKQDSAAMVDAIEGLEADLENRGFTLAHQLFALEAVEETHTKLLEPSNEEAKIIELCGPARKFIQLAMEVHDLVLEGDIDGAEEVAEEAQDYAPSYMDLFKFAFAVRKAA